MNVLAAAYDIFGFSEPMAIMIVGILGLLMLAAIRFRNPAAGAAWSFSLMMLIMGNLFDFGAELFWISVLGTIVVLVAGMIVRWTS